MTRFLSILIVGITALSLAACSNARKELGLEKSAPDEFAVIKRAPLELPPDYSLRPPRPGAPRPQEQSPTLQAKQTVFGAEKIEPAASATSRSLTQGESILLQKTGAYQSDPNIRDTIDAETNELAEENKPTIDRILSVTGKKYEAPADVVDAPAELERIKQNQAEGKPINLGETPSVED